LRDGHYFLLDDHAEVIVIAVLVGQEIEHCLVPIADRWLRAADGLLRLAIALLQQLLV